MGAYREITTNEAARALAARLNGNERTRPIVVVTTPAGRSDPWIDVEDIVAKVGDLAEVHLMPTGEHTWELSNNLPPGTQVYGGAGRVYPVGHEWANDLRRSPLRFAYDASDGPDATRLLIDDALRMAAAVGLLDSKPAARRVRRTGRVEAIIAERAVMRLGRDMGLVPDALAFPGVPLVRTLIKGMEIDGEYDPDSRWFDVREGRLDPQVALSAYELGNLVLAQVESVTADIATLFLHPLVAVSVAREQVTGNDLDDLRTLMTPGEILAAHVVAPGPDWQLSLREVDDDEVPVPAISLFAGGPPWLELPADFELAFDEVVEEPPPPVVIPALPSPPVVESSVRQTESTAQSPPRPNPMLLDPRRRSDEPLPAPVTPLRPAAPPTQTVQQMSLKISALEAQLRQLQAERDTAVQDARAHLVDIQFLQSEGRKKTAAIERLEQQLAASRSKLRKTRTQSMDGSGPRFADPERGFRFLVDLAWATRIPEGEQLALPLPPYDIGPEFLASIDALDFSREKIADVVMEVVTGKASKSSGRELHQLRTSDSGNAPQITRADGSGAWRVALQINTPSARRLHYWVLQGGRVELSRVVLHDDMKP